MTALLPAAALVVLLTACSSSSQGSVTGELTDLDGRACVRTELDNGFCFDADGAQLAGLATGQCVTLDYDRAGDAQLGRVTGIRSAPTPCVG